MNTKRGKVIVDIDKQFDIEQSANRVIKELNYYVSKYGNGVFLEKREETYGNSYSIVVCYMRDETDFEYEGRLELQAKMEERRREQDLKKLAALKEKYGE